MKRTLTAGAVLAALCGLGLAQLGRADDKNDSRPEDQHFVKKVSAADLAEISLGRLAMQRASNPEVRNFGQKMVQDHTKSSSDLLAILNRKGLQASLQMEDKAREMFDKLAKMNGPDFDRAYTKHMVKDHEEAVQLFTKASKNCKDEDLKTFAARTLPVIQQHFDMAKRLAGQGEGSAVSKQPEAR